MKIVVATPLYPPDIAEPAPYVKELARRLASRHEVVLVTYGRLPEKVPGVAILAIDKLQPLPLRLLAFWRALERAARRADVVYAMNGASVELPAALVSLTHSKPFIFGIADLPAHERAARNLLLRLLEKLAHGRSIVRDFPLPRPEILPLEPRPEAALAAYEASWRTHLALLENTFSHA